MIIIPFFDKMAEFFVFCGYDLKLILTEKNLLHNSNPCMTCGCSHVPMWWQGASLPGHHSGVSI